MTEYTNILKKEGMRYDEEKNNGKQNCQICIIDHGIGDCRINRSGEPGSDRRYKGSDIWGMATKTGICK